MAKAQLAKLGVALLPLAVAGAVLYATRAPSEVTYASDQALEAALLAPCCYNGTLTTHDSELARDLRNEIEHRHAGGESLGRIEKDIVGRYGDRVLAMPNQNRFVRLMSVAVAVALAGVVALALFVRRMRKNAGIQADKPRIAPVRDEWDDRIDEELMTDQSW